MKKNKLSVLNMLAFLSLQVGCASAINVPDVEIFKEVPFIDGAEGISYKIRSEAVLSYRPTAWEQKKPELICVDEKGWYSIKKSWLEACRFAGTKECDLDVQTIETTIRALDNLAKKLLKDQRLVP